MSIEIVVKVKRLPHSEGLPLPKYQTAGSVGMDLSAAISGSWTIQPFERCTLPTGLAIEIPPGFEAQIRTRSGCGIKQGLVIVNSPGTIDSDYRGEVLLAIYNLSSEPKTIERGDRLAQVIFAPVAKATLLELDELSETVRGDGGLGSTGSK